MTDDDKLIIIRSKDENSWERFGNHAWPFAGSEGGYRDSQAINKIITDDQNHMDYYWETVSLSYFNQFKKPFC